MDRSVNSIGRGLGPLQYAAVMIEYSAPDGVRMVAHESGAGAALICLPGGPMQASSVLGDLGGVDVHQRVVRVDLRGTGDSARPDDPLTYRCDRQVDDIEALRCHLALDHVNLLGHSAGGTLAVLYALRYPERVARLVLVAPSPRVVGVEVADADRREVAQQRATEPWYEEAFGAFERIWAGAAGEADWTAITPFTYGRWDEAARHHAAEGDRSRNDEAAAQFYADGAFDTSAVKARLLTFDVPVLLITGAIDVALPPRCATEYAALFANGHLVVQPGAGHSPWLDGPEEFAQAVNSFL